MFELSRIRVLVADSSPSDMNASIAVLSNDPEIEVVGIALTGKQAATLISNLKPDILVISESVQNPDLLETVKTIMAYNPTPILILADSAYEQTSDKILKALSMGALDVIGKTTGVYEAENFKHHPFKEKNSQRPLYNELRSARLAEMVKFLSEIKVVTHLAGKLEKDRNCTNFAGREHSYELHKPRAVDTNVKKVIAIAASTGGPSALVEILRSLPARMNMSIVIVQHITEGFSEGLAEWLDRESEMTVREARNGDRVETGHAIIAPTGLHIMLTAGDRIVLKEGLPVAGHKPAADVLFASVAEAYGRDSIGIILTGMGTDGANGIVAIKKAGGRTIVQDEQSCVVFGMPRAAIQTGAVDEILPLSHIAKRINQILSS